ncbi:MAG: response regulator [Dehalococcoidia bacterium]|nr:response regulator [Dehalococcoidia bacterium]
MRTPAARDDPAPVRILIVDDNVDDVVMTRMACRAWLSHEVHVARDGEEALELLLGSPGADRPEPFRPDVILLDLGLPRVNGIEVLRALRANPGVSAVPVIVLSGSDREEDIAVCQELGSNAYIQKPLNVPKFVRALEVLQKFGLVSVTRLEGEGSHDG